jgi:hypothetical protein
MPCPSCFAAPGPITMEADGVKCITGYGAGPATKTFCRRSKEGELTDMDIDKLLGSGEQCTMEQPPHLHHRLHHVHRRLLLRSGFNNHGIFGETFVSQVKDSFRSNLVMNDFMRPLQVEEVKYDLGGLHRQGL